MNQKKQTDKHTFVICAYGESPYLDECIQSLLTQTVESRIYMVTSTPNEWIAARAREYGIELRVNQGESGLAGDWNFAIDQAESELVTLAHQDDVYLPEYTESILAESKRAADPIILFTDYCELREGETVMRNRLLAVKRIMLTPLKCRCFAKSRFIRRRILSLGSAISCPTVTMVKRRLPAVLFRNNMKSNIDWQAWEELSREKGSFVYVPRVLVKHRIHRESTTSRLLEHSARREEDLFMYRKFWPGWMARFIEFFYVRNEKSNELDD
ncbi:MAG: glycosyltransferase family 2 protein [Lachnospiraceae bacterium]|nr:glycosyltransferase family 2 protein [Lachnospiraceae bacterium]